MVLLGCTPPGRNTEQHDIFFGIANSLEALVPAIKASWPEGIVHIDSWREVCYANGYTVNITPRTANNTLTEKLKLYFINLGGYKPNDMAEYHYKMVVAATDIGAAVRMSKETAFYMHTGIPGGPSHVDDKFGIDVDDAVEIGELLSPQDKTAYTIHLLPGNGEDELHIGYIKL